MRPLKLASGAGLWIDTVEAEGTVVIRVGGEVDLSSGDRLRAALEAAEARVTPPAPIVLDLTAVTFFGSPGWRLLARHHPRCQAIGSRLQVLTRDDTVRHTLEALGMERLLAPGHRHN